MPVKVGIVDSGLAPALAARLAGAVTVVPGGQLLASAAFVDAGAGTVHAVPAVADPLGHGSQVAELILAAAPAARLACAQVFAARQPVTAEIVAAGLRWCVAHHVRVVNLSLGLREDRGALRAACATAAAAGVLLVASAPARGGPVYPAAYPGVLAVSGDARCAPGTWSLIDGLDLVGTSPWGPSAAAGTPSDRDGGRPPALSPPPPPGGASFAAARLSGLAAAFFTDFPQGTAEDFRAALRAGAAFSGRERHTLEVAA
jgi:hypothetical protein